MQSSKKVVPHVFWNCPEEFLSRPSLGTKKEGKYSYIKYSELQEKASYFAAYLHMNGFKKGEKLIVLSENREEWIVSDLGTMFVGGVVVPVYPTLSLQQLEYIVQHCEARFVVVSNQIHYSKMLSLFKKNNLPLHIIVMNAEADLNPSSEDISSVYFQEVYKVGKKTWHEESSFLLEEMDKIQEDEVCSIIYTSGTTGEPKGVMLTHRNFVFSAIHGIHIQFARFLSKGVVPKDLSILPLAHVFARMVYLSILVIAGGNLAFAENFNTVPTNLKEVKPNVMVAVPRIYETIHNRILNEIQRSSYFKKQLAMWALDIAKEYILIRFSGKKPSWKLTWKYRLGYHLVYKKIHQLFGGNLLALLSAGAKLNEETSIFYCSLGLRLTEGYGLTETAPTITCTRPRKILWGSVGKVVKGVKIKLDTDGEILVKGPNVMKGYYKNEAATRAVFDEEGWFRTGDLGEINKDGFLQIKGRKKDIIVMSNGKNVSPNPIENLLMTSPYIEQAILIGDERPYISALIVPKFEAVKLWLKENGSSILNHEKLVQDSSVKELFHKEIKRLTSSQLAKYEQIKKFCVLSREFSQEKNEVTPTLKIKRQIVQNNFLEEINSLYFQQSHEEAA